MNNDIACFEKEIVVYNSEHLSLHPDLYGMVWMINESKAEPSAVSPLLPIAKSEYPVPPPNYYPSYKGLSANQRYEYLRLLSNPYDETFNIGYCFLLLYGLERHLIIGNAEQAAKIILGMLKAHHNNRSFREYAIDALIFASVVKSSPDFFICIDDEFLTPEKLLLKYALSGKEITSFNIISNCRKYGFTNTRYIKAYPDLFEEELKTVLIEKYGVPGLPIQGYYSAHVPKKISLVLSNYSFEKREFAMPNLFSHPRLKKDVGEFMKVAHERVKLKINSMPSTDRPSAGI